MKCCNCNATIPDESKFCMECGAKQIEKGGCPNCGATDLPKEALFCPHCGEELKKRKKVVTKNEPAREPVTPDDARDLFFPLNGLTLGKTTMNDARKKHLRVDHLFDDEESCDWTENNSLTSFTKGPYCTRKMNEKHINHLFIMSSDQYPSEWKDRHNLSFESTRKEWTSFFHKYGFSITERRNVTRFLKGTDSIIAISPDGRLTVNLLFGSDNNLLQQMNIDYDEPVSEEKMEPEEHELEIPYDESELREIQREYEEYHFPLPSEVPVRRRFSRLPLNDILSPMDCGVILGWTTILEGSLFNYKFIETKYYSQEMPMSCLEIEGNDYFDEDGDGIIDSCLITDNTLPKKWGSAGLSYQMSYNEWIKWFVKNGFSYKITQSPTVSNDSIYKGSLSAELEGYNKKLGIKITLEFDYSCKSSVNDSGTLYSISVSRPMKTLEKLLG